MRSRGCSFRRLRVSRVHQATEADRGNKEAELMSEGTVAERVNERVERVKGVCERH